MELKVLLIISVIVSAIFVFLANVFLISTLKIGISHNKNIDTKDYVLGKFKGDDWKVLTDSYNKVLDIVENFISKDVNTLKQIYSNKNN